MVTPRPGRCAEHGGLMWSDAMRACITPDDVIRGGCQWEPLDRPEMATRSPFDDEIVRRLGGQP